jgi:hypothetical protein
MWCCFVKPDFFENAEDVCLDGINVRFAQRFITAALLTRIYGLDVFSKWSTA